MDIYSQLERDEGFRPFPYRDSVGILTVGIGRNLENVGVSKEEALFLLQNDVAKAIAGLRQALPWFDWLTVRRQAVLVNMAFNMGVAGVLEFRHMLDNLEKGDYEKSAAEMLDSLWSSQVGQRAARLAQQMRSDQWV